MGASNRYGYCRWGLGLMEFAFEKVFREDTNDIKPRKTRNVKKSLDIGMTTADELFRQTTGDSIVVDPNTFEKTTVSEVSATAENSAMGGTMITLGMDGVVVYDSPPSGGGLSADWFERAYQILLDRVSGGEPVVATIANLAKEFSGFFEQQYVAFDFAADALGRKAHRLGLLAQHEMVESFDTDGTFRTTGTTHVVEYAGRKTLLVEHGNRRMLLVDFRRPSHLRFKPK